MVDMVHLAYKIRFCHPSLMMLLVNRPHRPRVHSKAIKVNNPNRSLNSHKLVPSLPPRISSRRTTPQILNNEMRTIITITNMACNKALKARMALLLNNDRSVGITGHNPRTPPNSRKVLLSKANLDMRPRVRDRTVATRPPILSLRASSLEPVKLLNHNPATSNSHYNNIRMVTLTILARTMLHT